ncbi:hypothetical protein ACOMHN_026558 [Nucella lapillus]
MSSKGKRQKFKGTECAIDRKVSCHWSGVVPLVRCRGQVSCYWSGIVPLVRCRGQVSCHWSGIVPLVRCRGQVSCHWSGVVPLIRCRAIGQVSGHWSGVCHWSPGDRPLVSAIPSSSVICHSRSHGSEQENDANRSTMPWLLVSKLVVVVTRYMTAGHLIGPPAGVLLKAPET